MNTHVTATIDELKGRRAELLDEITGIDELVRDLERHFNGSPPKKPISVPRDAVAKDPPPHSLGEALASRAVIDGKPAFTVEELPLPDEAKAYLADPPNNLKATPLSPEAQKIGLSLREPFTPTDLAARLDAGPNSDRTSRAYQWIAQWKNKNWITTVGFGSYRRTEGFGK